MKRSIVYINVKGVVFDENPTQEMVEKLHLKNKYGKEQEFNP